MALTLAQQLANVEAAILKAESAQSLGAEGESTTRPSLQVLYNRRDKIEARINKAANGDRTIAEF